MANTAVSGTRVPCSGGSHSDGVKRGCRHGVACVSMALGQAIVACGHHHCHTNCLRLGDHLVQGPQVHEASQAGADDGRLLAVHHHPVNGSLKPAEAPTAGVAEHLHGMHRRPWRNACRGASDGACAMGAVTVVIPSAVRVRRRTLVDAVAVDLERRDRAVAIKLRVRRHDARVHDVDVDPLPGRRCVVVAIEALTVVNAVQAPEACGGRVYRKLRYQVHVVVLLCVECAGVALEHLAKFRLHAAEDEEGNAVPGWVALELNAGVPRQAGAEVAHGLVRGVRGELDDERPHLLWLVMIMAAVL